MNIEDLYEWAVRKGVTHYEIEIQYRDGGGYYHGTETLCEADIEINHDKSEVVL